MRHRKLWLITLAIIAIAVSLDVAGRSEGFALVHYFRTPGMLVADLTFPVGKNGMSGNQIGSSLWLMVGVDVICWFALCGATYGLVWKLTHKRRTPP